MKLQAEHVEHDLKVHSQLEVRALQPGLVFEGVVTDSRLEVAGRLFIALRGERYDGHDFVRTAVERGATGVVIDRRAAGRFEDLEPACFIVEDTLGALQRLATASLERHPTRVIAITGSNGKTTTKDLVRAALDSLGPTFATPGNQNNHIGVPLTILGRSGEETFLVAEVGANDFGEIEMLSRMLRPEVAVITNIGRAHLERFGSVDGVRRAKSEIFTGLRAGGLGVLCADDVQSVKILHSLRGHRVVTFGFDPGAAYRIEAARPHQTGSQEIVIGGANFELHRPGHAHALNAAAAFAVACELGAQPAAIGRALQVCTYAGQRTCWLHLGDLRVLDDTYNANPDSVHEALQLLIAQPGRRIAVLGDMLELGSSSRDLHAEIGEQIARAGVDALFAFGESMQWAARAARQMGLETTFHFERMELLVEALQEYLRPHDVVLVKGSRGCRMERVIAAMKAEVA